MRLRDTCRLKRPAAAGAEAGAGGIGLAAARAGIERAGLDCWPAGGTFTVTLKGWPQAGIGMPSAAAMPAAWMALNSRTRPGMKKHSMKPRIQVMPVQEKHR